LIAVAFGLNVFMADSVSSARLNIGGSPIDIEIIGGPFDLPPERILDWVRAAATAVSVYYGRFPVPQLQLRIRATEGGGVHSGKTFPRGDGGRITIAVGRSVSQAELNQDWMLTHEMVHLAFPNMAEEHHWIEEGLATYVEPWARVQAGALTPEKVWGDVVRDMPQGLPKPGDRGLDRTPTWGRTYWGGALYCLLADVKLREQTHNEHGLRDALRAINRDNNIPDDMDIEPVLEEGDESLGATALMDLYKEMATSPFPVDLDALWSQLGIRVSDGRVLFNDRAPLAAVRRGIEKG
jgi:hypothetical protein